MSAEKIKQILEVIETALKMHAEWHNKLIRTCLCRTSMDDSYVAKDAHRKCNFGHWFYTQNDSSFHSLPSAKKIGALHKTMHDSARELSIQMKVSGMVQEKEYDYFVQNMSLFKEELVAFRQRVLDTLKSLSSK